jgi:hypothetical protein
VLRWASADEAKKKMAIVLIPINFETVICSSLVLKFTITTAVANRRYNACPLTQQSICQSKQR